jgi:hypothetical protein
VRTGVLICSDEIDTVAQKQEIQSEHHRIIR